MNGTEKVVKHLEMTQAVITVWEATVSWLKAGA